MVNLVLNHIGIDSEQTVYSLHKVALKKCSSPKSKVKEVKQGAVEV